MATARIPVAAALLLLFGAAPARGSGAPAPPAAAAQEVSRGDWAASMRAALPALFCEKGGYFRACFEIGAEECEKLAATATHACLDALAPKLPARLRMPDDGKEWAAQLGACAGQKFEVALLGHSKVDSEKCRDAAGWR